MNTTKNPPIVYLRVSTAEQETDSQEHQVLEYCKVRGGQPPLILRDAGSGASSSRPGLEQMLAHVRGGAVHQVVTCKLDRLGHSLTHRAIIVGELQMRNVALICTSQGIDTSKQNEVCPCQGRTCGCDVSSNDSSVWRNTPAGIPSGLASCFFSPELPLSGRSSLLQALHF